MKSGFHKIYSYCTCAFQEIVIQSMGRLKLSAILRDLGLKSFLGTSKKYNFKLLNGAIFIWLIRSCVGMH